MDFRSEPRASFLRRIHVNRFLLFLFAGDGGCRAANEARFLADALGNLRRAARSENRTKNQNRRNRRHFASFRLRRMLNLNHMETPSNKIYPLPLRRAL